MIDFGITSTFVDLYEFGIRYTSFTFEVFLAALSIWI